MAQRPIHQVGVPPIPVDHIRIVESEPFDLHANFRSHEPVRDSSTGGWFGIAVMVVVSAAIGAMLAVML